MRPPEVRCRSFVELVTDYLEGALPVETRERIDAHLSRCEGCTAYLEQVRTVIRLTGLLTEERVPEEARRALGAVFREHGPRS